MMLLNLVVIIIPWGVAWRLGRGLGWLSYHIFPIRKDIIHRNLLRAYPELRDEERENITLSCYQHWGESFMSTLKLWIMPKRKIKRLVTAPTLTDLIDEARTAGAAMLYFTGHYGSWEMAGRFVCDYAGMGSSIYRVQKNPLSEWWLSGIREARNMRLIGSRLGISTFIAAMQESGCIAVVGDQYKANNAITVEFFGLPSRTPKGIAVIAQRSNPWLIFLVSRQTRGHFYIDVEKVPYEAQAELNDEWIREVTQLLTHKLEAEIRKHPEQYFWFHQRWRDLDRRDRKARAIPSN